MARPVTSAQGFFATKILRGTTFIFIIFLSGCGQHLFHIVEPGESLYSISWMYGHDYQKVAQWNQLKPPFVIRKGQRLRVAAPVGYPGSRKTPALDDKQSAFSKNVSAKREPVRKSLPLKADMRGNKTSYLTTESSTAKPTGETARKTGLKWRWPINSGKLIQSFDAKDPGKRGLDIVGRRNQAIFSAASGRVVYSGSGLPRYGKLIIVKHSDEYLSAYAHNKALRVKQGERVKSGQHIADMGSSGTRRTKLHFEIRRNGKAIDPLQLLPKPGPVK